MLFRLIAGMISLHSLLLVLLIALVQTFVSYSLPSWAFILTYCGHGPVTPSDLILACCPSVCYTEIAVFHSVGLADC